MTIVKINQVSYCEIIINDYKWRQRTWKTKGTILPVVMLKMFKAQRTDVLQPKQAHNWNVGVRKMLQNQHISDQLYVLSVWPGETCQCESCCFTLMHTHHFIFYLVQKVLVEEQTGTASVPSGPSWAVEGWTAGPLEAEGPMKEVGPAPHLRCPSQSRPWSCCTGCCCCCYSGTGHTSWSWSCSCVLRPCCCDLCRRRKKSGPRPGCFLHGYLCCHGCSCRDCL